MQTHVLEAHDTSVIYATEVMLKALYGMKKK